MIGKEGTMPKRARYPVFLLGLAIIIGGGIMAEARGAAPSDLAAIVLAGFALLVLSVVIR